MASKFLNIRSGIGLKPGTAPSDPADGDAYYDSGTNKLTVRENGVWVTYSTGGTAAPAWTKYTFSHTAFQTAGLTNDLELVNLAQKTMIHQVIIKQSTQFAGTGITSYSFSVGIASNFLKYSAAFLASQAVSNTARSITHADEIESFTGSTSIRIQATSTGANLNQSTAGSVDVWVLTSALP